MTPWIEEAARKIYEAQCDVGRTYDNSLTQEEIAKVIEAEWLAVKDSL